ncbi:SRPBCC domain-containing protein [Demequina sp. SO4-18]|uniref:SRPBCC domain-containing protein n=1 Tax=Demequina sp. SO4-18 TaxID=3401026 RepID=UPI003B5BFA03
MVEATGTVVDGEHGPELVFQRVYHVPAKTVWAHVAESDHLQKWIGRWETDQSTGRVLFYMTAESDEPEGEECLVRACSPPHRLVVDTRTPRGTWHLTVGIQTTLDGTVLTFAQRLGSEGLDSIGPGWEYYLDRLSAVLGGESADDIRWDDYYPAMADHYAALAPEGGVAPNPPKDGLEH